MAKQKEKSNLPEGFTPLARKSVDGWYTVEAGNIIRGFYRGSFEVPDRFRKGGKKTVHKIELTTPGTNCTNAEGAQFDAEEGALIGVDEKGWLGGLVDVEEGSEVYIKCTGKGKPREGMSAPWLFDLGVKKSDDKVPF